MARAKASYLAADFEDARTSADEVLKKANRKTTSNTVH